MRILGAIRQSIAHGILGGMELTTHDLYKGLVEKGCEVSVLTTQLKNSDEMTKTIDGVEYIFIAQAETGKYSNEYHFGVRDYFNLLIEQNNIPDIIHSASGAAAILRQNTQKVPVIATWHGTRIEEELDKIANYVYVQGKRLLPKHFEGVYLGSIAPFVQNGDFTKFDAHVAISPYMGKCIQSYGVSATQVHIIRNALPDVFVQNRPKVHKIGKKITLGVVGRIVPMKGHLFFQEVMQHLDSEKYEILVVGAGESAEQYRQASSLHVEAIKVSREEMPTAYQQMDIFINPTFRSSGFDLTVQEALVSGVVTLISDLTPYADYFNELKQKFAENSPLFMFNVGNIQSCLNAINRVAVNLQPMNDEVTAYFQSEFQQERMIDEYLSVFKQYAVKKEI